MSGQVVRHCEYRKCLDQAVELSGYREKHGKYAAAVADLGLGKSPLGPPELEATRNTFEARLTASKAQGGKTWTITHDGRISANDK